MGVCTSKKSNINNDINMKKNRKESPNEINKSSPNEQTTEDDRSTDDIAPPPPPVPDNFDSNDDAYRSQDSMDDENLDFPHQTNDIDNEKQSIGSISMRDSIDVMKNTDSWDADRWKRESSDDNRSNYSNNNRKPKPVAWEFDMKDTTSTSSPHKRNSSSNHKEPVAWDVDVPSSPEKEKKPAFGAGRVDRLLAEKKLEEERLRLKARRKRLLAKARAEKKAKQLSASVVHEEDVDLQDKESNRNSEDNEDNSDDDDDDDDTAGVKEAIKRASLSQVFNVLQNKSYANASTQTENTQTHEIIIQTDISGWSGVMNTNSSTTPTNISEPSTPSKKEQDTRYSNYSDSRKLSSDLSALKARLNNLSKTPNSARTSWSASPIKRSKSMIVPDSARSRSEYRRSGRRSPTVRRDLTRRNSVPILSIDESSSESGDTDDSGDEAAQRRLPLHQRSDSTKTQSRTVLRSQSTKRLRTTGIARSIKSGVEFTVQIGPRKRKCFLKGVVPPEHDRYFDQAKRTLSRMINAKEVTLDVWKTKQRGEVWIADVYLGAVNVREELLKIGLVRLKKSEKRHDLRHYAAEARKNGLGMWSLEAPKLDMPEMEM